MYSGIDTLHIASYSYVILMKHENVCSTDITYNTYIVCDNKKNCT